jgi:hypothetical protein
MTGLDLIAGVLLLALAAGAIVDVWLNGSIFAGWRARIEAREGRLSELLGCSLCLNYQVAGWLTLLFWVPVVTGAPHWVKVALLAVLVVLAAGRLAWILNAHLWQGAAYDRGGHDERAEEDH